MMPIEFEETFSELEISLEVLERDLYELRFRLQKVKRGLKKLYETTMKSNLEDDK